VIVIGDRANFGFKQTDGNTIFLYSHWGGEGMMNTLAEALYHAKPRWSDCHYGARMAISHIIGNDWKDELGFGISVNQLCDNEHSVPVVDFKTQTVSLYDASWDIPFTQTNPKFTMGFDAFVNKFAKYLTNA